MLVLMVLMRDVHRLMLGDAARLDVVEVAPQWPVLALFAARLVAGLATLGWMPSRPGVLRISPPRPR